MQGRMKHAIVSLVASALVTCGAGRAAWAQKTRVVIEQFQGPGADKLRQMVAGALRHQAVEVVPDKKVAAAEANLGLLSVSDNYPAVAKDLGASLFIGGSLGGTKKVTARIKIKDATGASAGDQPWSGPSQAKVLAAVEKSLGATLDRLLGVAARRQPAQAEKPAPVAVAQKPTVDEAPKPTRRPAKRAEEDVRPPAKETEAEATVSAATEPEAGAPAAWLSGLDAALGVRFYGRHLTYKQKITRLPQSYSVPKILAPYVPSINVAVDYFFHEYVGVTVGGEYSLGLFSKEHGAGCPDSGCVYKTGSYGFWGGVKGRYRISIAELTGHVGYGLHRFHVLPDADDMFAPQVPAANYGHIRAGGGARVGVNDKLSILAGGAYLHLLTYGELKDVYFKFATGRGGEGYVGAAYALPWLSGLEARALVDFRRYVFAMNSEQNDLKDNLKDPQVGAAGGATDQYLGLTLAFGFRGR